MCEFEEDLEEFAHAEYLEDNYPDLDPEEAEYVDYMLATGEGPLGNSSGCLLTVLVLASYMCVTIN
tara:strand:- start:291 stop:488 length:198 start_codon:yes stop_codon:yes gene_type:complete